MPKLLNSIIIIGLIIIIAINNKIVQGSKTAHRIIKQSRFESFRNEVINLIQSELTGLISSNPLVDPLDTLFPGELPVLSNLVRLVFHDCAGLNNYGVPICNGCLDLNNPINNAFEIGSIGPMNDICDEYSGDGISLADCWILAATFGLEIAANTSIPVLQTFIPDLQVSLKRGDIPYYYGREDCLTAPQNEKIFPEETFPEPTFYWDETEQFFKKRFGSSWTNKEIVTLIAGGHSLGRAHAKLTKFSGPWDFTPQGLDNVYLKNILNNDPLIVITSEDTFYQGRIRSDLNVQWFNKFSNSTVQQFNLAQNNVGLMLTSDISMAFDLKKYGLKNNRENIDCVTSAYVICPKNSTILIADNGQNITKSKQNNNNVCSYRQCPVQCPSNEITLEDLFTQNQKLDKKLSNKLSKISPNSKCTAAFILQYSKNNDLFVKDFAKIWTKLITVGYVNRNGQVLLQKIN